MAERSDGGIVVDHGVDEHVDERAAAGVDGMTGSTLTPFVDLERERLAAELAEVDQQLAEARMERSDLEGRITVFAALHDRVIAPLYAELDGIRADIAELLAERSGLPEDRADAARARARAERSARAARAATEQRPPSSSFDDVAAPRVRPSDDARRLFRALMKRCHPDLAVDDDERERRERFSRAVNDAYAENDLDLLEQLERQWSLDEGGPSGGGASREELAAAVASARRELAAVRDEVGALGATGMGRLLLGAGDPAAAVDAVAARIDAEIDRQRQALERLEGGR